MEAGGVATGTTRCPACGSEASVLIQEEDAEHAHIHVICDDCGFEVWGEAVETTEN